MTSTCEKSGISFSISSFEQEMRRRLGVPQARIHPRLRFRDLLSFWQHFHLHRRPCGLSGRDIISVYDTQCPYPVWHRDQWISQANPPGAQFDPGRPFFEQLWSLFQRCPIPHNIGLGNENCEYSDDWWFSKNCYLCHSGVECEDCHYCYRTLGCTDCQYCVFSFHSSLCRDLVDCARCYSVLFAIDCHNCTDSAFLFDCRNCSHCFLCWNLRNKSYCIENVQYSREEYLARIQAAQLSSQHHYSRARQRFELLLTTAAYWKAQQMEKSENSSGAYLLNTKNCENTFFCSDSEDCVNFMRGGSLKEVIDSVNCYRAQRVFMTAGAVDNTYEIHYCYNIAQSQFLEYCAFCFNCRNCFGCCGLVGKEYHILNRPYKPDDYKKTVSSIHQLLERNGLTGSFFPPYFTAHPYGESLAAFYFPLDEGEQRRMGFRPGLTENRKRSSEKIASEVPDSITPASDNLVQTTFWDDVVQRPFRITAHDIEFAKKTFFPLPNRYYSRHIQELFSWMFFRGELRKTVCARSSRYALTHLPQRLDGRILCQEEYLSLIN